MIHTTPVNPNATPEATALLQYLHDIAGTNILAGQHTQTNPMEEVAYIETVTGKSPKLCGFELLAYSPNIRMEGASEACRVEVEENRNTMDTALRWANETGGIVTLTFHWFSPLGGHDKSFYTEHTDFDAERVLHDGTPERAAFFHDLDAIAVQLQRRFCGDRSTRQKVLGSGGGQRVQRLRSSYTCSCMNTMCITTTLTICSGSGTVGCRRGIRGIILWMLFPWMSTCRTMKQQTMQPIIRR